VSRLDKGAWQCWREEKAKMNDWSLGRKYTDFTKREKLLFWIWSALAFFMGTVAAVAFVKHVIS
jgi:hypothetical protein